MAACTGLGTLVLGYQAIALECGFPKSHLLR